MTSTWAKNDGRERAKKEQKKQRKLRAALNDAGVGRRPQPVAPGNKVHGPLKRARTNLEPI